MKKAFTLAEVLITLGIIGVVAATAIPAIVAKYRKKVIETKLQVAYSVINSVIKLSETENDSCDLWQYPTENASSSKKGTEETKEFIDKYIKPYLKYVSADILKTENSVVYNVDGSKSYISDSLNKVPSLMLEDGIWLIFIPTVQHVLSTTHYRMIVYVGVKDKASKFIQGKNLFAFIINSSSGITKISAGRSDWSCGYLENQRSNFIENCKKELVETSGIVSATYCTYMIYCNNWKIPDDYPIRL